MPKKNLTIDKILAGWDFDPLQPTARLVKHPDGRDVLQLRVDLGVLQMEIVGRPDGTKPFGFATLLDWIKHRDQEVDAAFKFSSEECLEVDREFSQFYHRRIGWIHMKAFARAATDAQHTLALMDACLSHSPDQEWAMMHEQHRPFVIFQRAQSLALQRVQEGGEPASAIEELNQGVGLIRAFYDTYELEQDFDDDELVQRLIHVRESLRERFEIGPTLDEQLAEAISNENFELAAILRDQIRNQHRS
ncbi:MAG: UvrB/UvrC motif-containing protein [Pirellulaceae bacterium]|nr:UvrB/UvrC motif-containing protein [Pirellulaceae bacterium]